MGLGLGMGLWLGSNPAGGGGAVAGTTWDAANSSAGWSFTNGALTVTPSGAGSARATKADTASGSFTVTVGAVGAGNPEIGVCNSSYLMTDFLGDSSNSSGYCANGAIIPGGPTGATWTTGDIIKVTWSGSVVTFFKWNGSTFVSQGSPSVSPTGPVYPAVSVNNTGGSFTLDASAW